jgi:hypothetical protein
MDPEATLKVSPEDIREPVADLAGVRLGADSSLAEELKGSESFFIRRRHMRRAGSQQEAGGQP